jgi:hypothetical protein
MVYKQKVNFHGLTMTLIGIKNNVATVCFTGSKGIPKNAFSELTDMGRHEFYGKINLPNPNFIVLD